MWNESFSPPIRSLCLTVRWADLWPGPKLALLLLEHGPLVVGQLVPAQRIELGRPVGVQRRVRLHLLDAITLLCLHHVVAKLLLGHSARLPW
jgi:hypothetical protein